jgi:hypothetical protein
VFTFKMEFTTHNFLSWNHTQDILNTPITQTQMNSQNPSNSLCRGPRNRRRLCKSIAFRDHRRAQRPRHSIELHDLTSLFSLHFPDPCLQCCQPFALSVFVLHLASAIRAILHRCYLVWRSRLLEEPRFDHFRHVTVVPLLKICRCLLAQVPEACELELSGPSRRIGVGDCPH